MGDFEKKNCPVSLFASNNSYFKKFVSPF